METLPSGPFREKRDGQAVGGWVIMLATLRLDPARMRLISGFIDSYLRYLRLNAQEELLFEQQAIALLDTTEQARVMELTTSWEEKGIEIGRREGQKEGLERERRLAKRRARQLR